MTTLLRRHVPFYLAIATAIAVYLLAHWLGSDVPWAIAANAFFAVYLALTLVGLPGLTADYLKKNAARADVPVWIIFLITAGAVAVAVVSLFMTINAKESPDAFDFTTALLAVPLGWLTIHMMTAIHYAHEYWQPDDDAGDARKGARKAQRGLEFPGTPEPRGIDFVYFAYVIGMTGQTSDTAITTSAMRNRVLVHGIVSFFFNTVLVAAAVNVAVTLGE
jgi:uncharacterized membrane protein